MAATSKIHDVNSQQIQLLINSKGFNKIWDCYGNVKSASWETTRTGEPGKFTFTLLKAGDISFTEGDIVRFSVNEKLQFFGWVFTKSKNRWGEIEVTCYDRTRYLKANASYAFYNVTAGDIIRQICGDLLIDVGEIEDTGYRLPSFVEEDQSCIDMITKALQQTLINTGNIYVCYDNGNGISLKQAANMKSDYMVGDLSLLTDYTYKTDIDEMTYNSIKLARPNEETGRTETFVVLDSDHIKQWGLLQLYQKVDEDMNDAQIMAQAKVSLQYYNRRMKTLSATSLGVPGLRAGQMLLMRVQNIGDQNLNQYVLLEKVTHNYENDTHTMDFDVRAL